MNIHLLNDRLRLGYFNIREAATLLKIRYHTVRDNIRRGAVPPPSYLIGRRRYYTAADVEALASIFADRPRYKIVTRSDLCSTGESACTSRSDI